MALINQTITSALWQGRSIAIVPFPALGDITIYLRIAQTFCAAGAVVSFYSNQLRPAADLFPWLTVPPARDETLAEISTRHDLVIVDFLANGVEEYCRDQQPNLDSGNIIVVTAKALPASLTFPEQMLPSFGPILHKPHRCFCGETRYGPSMVDCVDRYVFEVFGLSPQNLPPCVTPPEDPPDDDRTEQRVLIFPTTPNPSKNFPLKGFAKLCTKLEQQGWKVEIVCMQKEKEELAKFFGNDRIRTFPNLRDLILHVMRASAVISNDSGGGHLASMLNLPTYTITKKKPDFVWRPGFNRKNTVISPVLTFKWLSGRIWHPFIPLGKISRSLGSPLA